MEKNQQNRTGGETSIHQQEAESGKQPGQQLPTGNKADLEQPSPVPDTMQQHSESSLPQRDEETLGTP